MTKNDVINRTSAMHRALVANRTARLDRENLVNGGLERLWDDERHIWESAVSDLGVPLRALMLWHEMGMPTDYLRAQGVVAWRRELAQEVVFQRREFAHTPEKPWGALCEFHPDVGPFRLRG